MKILVLNCGSSSLKYQLINMENEEVITKGTYERIGMNNSFITVKQDGEKIRIEHPVKNHEKALKFVFEDVLMGEEYGKIKSLREIDAIGHRVVHGGEKFKEAVLVTDEVINEIREVIPLAPLHNPAALLGIEACKSVVPEMPMAVIFDTAFHQTMPKESYMYPLPYEFYEKYKVRKYGFHGTSHRYVSNRVAEVIGKDIKDLKIVTCHLGQGASLCAIKDGKSVNTSMGLTPLGGIGMCARSGDLDPSVVGFLMDNLNISASEMMEVLNKQSGILGISGISADFRDVEAAKDENNERAILAIDMYNKIVAEYIARYMVSLKGLDVIVFTAGVGENQIRIRKGICENLSFLGIKIDDEKNNSRGEEVEISTADSKIKVFVIPTDEEIMIARDTMALISK
ncbi:MAG: acetate kinase [Clostridia bacterium]|nr:acetate kinase [Clostridia bacterium]